MHVIFILQLLSSHQFNNNVNVDAFAPVKSNYIKQHHHQHDNHHLTFASSSESNEDRDDKTNDENGSIDTKNVWGNAFSTFGDYYRPAYSTTLIKKKKKSQRRSRRSTLFNRMLNKRNSKKEKSKAESDEDGYAKIMLSKKNRYSTKVMRAPFKLVKRILFPGIGREPGTLILVRHGESTWNKNKTFTGWADPDLSERGNREIEHAGRLLLEGGYQIDVVFTSRLKRAIRSVWILLQELNQVYIPVFKSWRLNERMYGALTGLSKTETAKQVGVDIVQEWRGSLNARPPPLSTTDGYWPGRDRKHADLSPDQIPLTESLLDCMNRTSPIWEDKISYELRKGNNVLVVAHANTLRGLVKLIDNIGDDEIQQVSIPTGIPIVYKFDNSRDLIPIKVNNNGVGASQKHVTGLFLEKPGLLKDALNREKLWRYCVPGYDSAMARSVKQPMTPLERSLNKLKAERELGEWAGQFIDPSSELEEDDGSDGNFGKPVAFVEHTKKIESGTPNVSEKIVSNINNPTVDNRKEENIAVSNNEDTTTTTPSSTVMLNVCQTSLPSTAIAGIGNIPTRKDSVIVMIRHGKTEHNKLGLFTGWEDAPLAKEGVDEAKEAGKLLKMHGFEFDVIYTSWLSRAIETAWIVMDELDCIWLPIVKTWRLNERMYGALTGLSKQMVRQRHGEKQFKAWRRGYKVRPPSVSSFSTDYPGNDMRYIKFMDDVRFSVSETLIRSIEGRRLKLHRKFPKSESLKNCMDRTIPYFTEQIVPEAINKGKRVLISSSENAIRGLLMHLLEIPEDRVVGLEIPNGLPLIFDVKSKCLKLLDDGTGRDPLERHNFGEAAQFLFKPCQNDDGSADEECDIRYMFDDVVPEADEDIINFIKRPKMSDREKIDTSMQL